MSRRIDCNILVQLVRRLSRLFVSFEWAFNILLPNRLIAIQVLVIPILSPNFLLNLNWSQQIGLVLDPTTSSTASSSATTTSSTPTSASTTCSLIAWILFILLLHFISLLLLRFFFFFITLLFFFLFEGYGYFRKRVSFVCTKTFGYFLWLCLVTLSLTYLIYCWGWG
jgi:hypothetical protein